jgi:hypothetical protein
MVFATGGALTGSSIGVDGVVCASATELAPKQVSSTATRRRNIGRRVEPAIARRRILWDMYFTKHFRDAGTICEVCTAAVSSAAKSSLPRRSVGGRPPVASRTHQR